MGTDYPQQLTDTDHPDAAAAGEPGPLARAAGRLGQALCGLSGHDAVMHFEGKRVTMRCTSCGHETPGWDVSGEGPRRMFEGDAGRHRMAGDERLALRKTA